MEVFFEEDSWWIKKCYSYDGNVMTISLIAGPEVLFLISAALYYDTRCYTDAFILDKLTTIHRQAEIYAVIEDNTTMYFSQLTTMRRQYRD